MSGRRALAIATAGLLLALPVPSPADDTDILGTGTVEPNVMILLDSSGSMDDSIPGGRKFDLARSVVTSLVSSASGVRFGVMKFGSGGAAMVAEIGTPAADIVDAVNAMAGPDGGTPLGDQLYDAGRYFKGDFGSYASPIDMACRRNTIIVVSDGMETSSSRDMRDEALLRQSQDHSTGYTGTQNIVVHTVGFAIPDEDEVVANSFLQQAATNGAGTFYSTSDAGELQDSLEAAITAVLAGAYAFASAVVPSTSATGSDRLYQGTIEIDGAKPFWRGRLAAYRRDADGRVPTDAGGLPLASSRIWDAGTLLAARSAASRTIFTEVGGVREPFTTGNGAITAGMLGVGSSAERSELIGFIRGVDTTDEDGDGNTTEQREWKLGDVLHSRPVLVSAPARISRDSTYMSYRTANAGRTPVVLVGANDGMLHAFRDSDGAELWAWIPPDLLGTLGALRPSVGAHPYYVDSSPVVADVLVGGAYRTIAVFGERRGGRSYHALDVTDTTTPAPLWSVTDPRMGETWSVPAIGRVSIGGTPTDVLFVGGGYDTAANNDTGKAFFVIDAATGAILWSYHDDGTTDDRQAMGYSVAASPTALDLDEDGLVDRVYVGDVGGQLWKFDVSDSAISGWAGKRVFTAAPGQPNPPPAGTWEPTQAIYGAPAAAYDRDGTLWVYFGTGDQNNPLNPSANRLYGLRETTTMTNGAAISEATLVDVTSTDASGGNGWYVRLPSNEKVFSPADVFDGSVFFTSFTPASTVTCSSGAGPAKLYAVQLDTGYAAYDWASGEKLDPSDSGKPRSAVAGTGIPSGPLVVTTPLDGALEASIVTSTSERQVDDVALPAVALRRPLYWREVYD